MGAFVLTAVGISLSGVLAPGPITAATLAAGIRSRHAGLLIALGHMALEFPSILLLVIGLGAYLEYASVRAALGLGGGAFLLLMGIQLLLSLRRTQDCPDAPVQRHPFWIGVILTGTSPYFWFWGATVGLNLTSQAMEFGLVAVALFALIHWTCDLGWLEVLSLAGFKGSEIFGQRSQQIVSAVCAVMLLGFGLMFIWDARKDLSSVLGGSPVDEASARPLAERIQGRTFPSVLQAWSPADNPRGEQKEAMRARHDLTGSGPALFGLSWNHKYQGLAEAFTEESVDRQDCSISRSEEA